MVAVLRVSISAKGIALQHALSAAAYAGLTYLFGWVERNGRIAAKVVVGLTLGAHIWCTERRIWLRGVRVTCLSVYSALRSKAAAEGAWAVRWQLAASRAVVSCTVDGAVWQVLWQLGGSWKGPGRLE